MAKNILSVDDSISMRQIIKACLSKEGYQISEAEDGVQALDKVKAGEKFDLFLVDVNMPNMDGITFVKEVRKIEKDVPIIMLTTEAQNSKKIAGQEAGANGWVLKPFDPKQFIRVVKRLID